MFCELDKQGVNAGAYGGRQSDCFSPLQLREFQQQRGISVPAAAKKKKKIKNGSSPETATSDGRQSPEDVSLGQPGFRGWGCAGGSGRQWLRLWKRCQVLVKLPLLLLGLRIGANYLSHVGL